MSECYGSENVRCPFYSEETKNAIKCEGVISKTCKHNFETSTQKKKHKGKYCNRTYFECPYYKQVNSKYP